MAAIQAPLTNLTENIIRRREVLVFNENTREPLWALEHNCYWAPKTRLSAVFCTPHLRRSISACRIWTGNMPSADVHLLTTLANSMSVALENARLFDQTQRLLARAAQRRAGHHQQRPAGAGGPGRLPGHHRPGGR